MRGVSISSRDKDNENDQTQIRDRTDCSTSRMNNAQEETMVGTDKSICEVLHAISDLAYQNTRICSIVAWIRKPFKLAVGRWIILTKNAAIS